MARTAPPGRRSPARPLDQPHACGGPGARGLSPRRRRAARSFPFPPRRGARSPRCLRGAPQPAPSRSERVRCRVRTACAPTRPRAAQPSVTHARCPRDCRARGRSRANARIAVARSRAAAARTRRSHRGRPAATRRRAATRTDPRSGGTARARPRGPRATSRGDIGCRTRPGRSGWPGSRSAASGQAGSRPSAERSGWNATRRRRDRAGSHGTPGRDGPPRSGIFG